MSRRLKELLAIGMIGEGIAGFLAPRSYALLWKCGPRPFQDFVDWFAERPHLTRALCMAETGLGLWLTWRETRR